MLKNITMQQSNKDTLLFICCNRKAAGKCCAMANSENIYEHMRQAINAKRAVITPGRRVKAVKTSCLGQCASGPNILVSPDNIWYTFSTAEDIDEIINSHILNGVVVDRLIKQDR